MATNRIEHFLLPENTNSLYKNEAISSISLTKEVAEKINEIVDRLNDIATTDISWKQEVEGKINKGVLYMKDNLVNTIHDLFDLVGLDVIEREVKENNSLLNTRLDNLLGLVKEGTTTMDAEIIDGRVADGGYSYSTIGEAIRTQISALEEAYGDYEHVDCGDPFENKLYDVRTGTIVSYASGNYIDYELEGEKILKVDGYSYSSNEKYPLATFYGADGEIVLAVRKADKDVEVRGAIVPVPAGAVRVVVQGQRDCKASISAFVKRSLLEDMKKCMSMTAANGDFVEVREYVKLTEDNAQVEDDCIYKADGLNYLPSNSKYSTITYKIPEGTRQVILDCYKVGKNGGAFLDEHYNIIATISTEDPDHLAVKRVPDDAVYMAVTAEKSNKFNYITLIKNVQKASTNHWAGKKVVMIGQSVPFGAVAGKSYIVECANALGFELVNASVPGQAVHLNAGSGSLCMGLYEYIQKGIEIPDEPIPYQPGGQYNNYYRTWNNVIIDNPDADMYLFDVLPNNTNFDTSEFDRFDFKNWTYSGDDFINSRNTFQGAMIFLMDKLYQYNPNARVAFVVSSEYNYDHVDALEAVAKKLRIPVIDLWGKMNFNKKTAKALKSNDGTDTHPSAFAHELMGKMMTNEMLLIA